MRIKINFVLLSVAALISFQACNTMEGLGKDIKNAGTSLERSAQKKTSKPESESE